MNILITNDDGINAGGLWALVAQLKQVGNVTVVAPDRDQSGTGTSVTLRHPLRLTQVNPTIEGVLAYSVEGTPADSVILGLKQAVKDKVDLVVSGINEGPNLGDDVFISGTVGAAIQGYFYGIPSLAFAVAAYENIYFDVAARMAKVMATILAEGVLPKKLLLNVNVPNVPREKIKGIEITRLGDRSYTDRVDTGHDGKRQYHWIVRGVPEWSVSPGTDIWALEQNKISITNYPQNSDHSIDSILGNMAGDIYKRLSEP